MTFLFCQPKRVLKESARKKWGNKKQSLLLLLAVFISIIQAMAHYPGAGSRSVPLYIPRIYFIAPCISQRFPESKNLSIRDGR